MSLPKVAALKEIRRILRNGIVLPTKHFNERLMERGFNMQDVLHVLKNGSIVGEPEVHHRSGRLIYTVGGGKTIDGKKLKIPVDIDGDVIKLVSGM